MVNIGGIDVAEGHRSALLSLAWQVCILCVYVCVCVCTCVDVRECLCVSSMLQRGTEAHCCRWHGRFVFCVCLYVCGYV